MHFLMARPEITSAALLKGKRVGVSSFGATGDLAARVALQSVGLDPNRDVTIVTLGSDTLRFAALQAGTVHATHMPLPFNIQMKKDGYRELFYAGKVLQRPLTGLATTTDKIQKNPRPGPPHGAGFSPHNPRAKKRTGRIYRLCAKEVWLSPKRSSRKRTRSWSTRFRSDGFVEDASLQSAIDEAKAVANDHQADDSRPTSSITVFSAKRFKIKGRVGFKPALRTGEFSCAMAASIRLLHRFRRQGKIENPLRWNRFFDAQRFPADFNDFFRRIGA